MTVGELLDKAEHYRSYWGNSHPDISQEKFRGSRDSGGITVSGGEALVQMDFLLELFREAHRRGINTCLDTSATLFRPNNKAWMDKFDALLDLTDTILLDIKHIDDTMHRRLTGHSNKAVLACARYLSQRGEPVWIRHVLVPGWTDKDEWLHALRAFIDTLKNVERVEVLPYHTMGVYKYEKLGIPYPLEGVPAPTQERIDNARRILAG